MHTLLRLSVWVDVVLSIQLPKIQRHLNKQIPDTESIAGFRSVHHGEIEIAEDAKLWDCCQCGWAKH